MRYFFIFLLAWLLSEVAWSVPAKRVPFTVTNSDGTTLTIVLRGDESFHFHTTLEGIPVVRQENGDWQLAPELADSLRQTWQQRKNSRNRGRIQKGRDVMAKQRSGRGAAYVGDKRGLVILVNFPDRKMKTANTQTKFHNMFNQEGYHEDGNAGSVHDYFNDQSYGQLNLLFDVYGPILADHDYAYYGGNDNDGNDSCVARLTIEACRKVDANEDIRWTDYDWNGDGEVEQVYIVYAGYGENESAPSTTIWAHEWTLAEGLEYGDGEGPITLGGCTINTYAMSQELRGRGGGSLMAGIGTACHEFSHCLGLPDFYNTDYSGGFGMQGWDLMDSGSYNGASSDGTCPAGFTAYERWFAGWLIPTELSQPSTVVGMPSLQDAPCAYILYNQGNRNEYFLLENRQNQKWYEYVETTTECHGLLVTHVDYNADVWKQNTPNSMPTHQRMTIVPAAGNYGVEYGTKEKGYYVSDDVYRSQLFPGTSNVVEFTNDSHTTTGGALFNRNSDDTYSLNLPITCITETDGLISFDLMGGGYLVDIHSPMAHPSSPIYYTLDGIPIERPTQRGIYIVKDGSQTRKVAF